MSMHPIDPNTTPRAQAFQWWMKAPNPMVTIFKTYDVTSLLAHSRLHSFKFNMLMCYCIGQAALRVKEFYLLPIQDKLYEFDLLAVNTIVKDKLGDIHSCDIPLCSSLIEFNETYLRLTEGVRQSRRDHDLSDKAMVIGTSALTHVDIDGVVGMYSGIFNNPMVFWGKYNTCNHITQLKISFQFHHTQMDGAQAGDFLNHLDGEIHSLQ